MFKRIVDHAQPKISTRISLRFVALLLTAFGAQVAHSTSAIAFADGPQSLPAATALELGKPLEREITGGQTQSYQITLAKDQFVDVTIQRRGVNVVEQSFAPNGNLIARFASEWRPEVKETVGFVAETAGAYRLDVKATIRGSVGRYEIQIGEIRSATEHDRLLDEAHRLSTEASTLGTAGKYQEAASLSVRAVGLAEKALGPNDGFVGLLLNELGSYQRNGGEYAKAEATLQRALAVNEKALGPDHTQTADSLNRLGLVYRATNDYAKAERLLRQSLEITERTLGPEHPRVVVFLDNLEAVEFDLGDLTQAEHDLERALAIAEKVLEPDNVDKARLLNNLGNLYRARGDYARAEPLLLRALALYEKKFGPENPRVGDTLQNLGIIARQRKDYARAVELYERALVIREKTVGPEHANVAALQNNIANIYHAERNYAKALELQQRALSIAEKAVGPYHGLTLTLLANIARTHMATGDIASAIQFQTRAEMGQEVAVALDLVIGSERQKLAYIDDLAESSARTISLNLSFAPNDQGAANLATLVLLQRKGRVLDAMSDSFTALRQRSNPADQKLLGQLNSAVERLAKLALSGPGKMAREEYQKQLTSLEEEKERLEAEVSERSAEFRAQSQPVTIAAVQAAIPNNAALIEFATYRPFDPKGVNSDEAFGKPHYVAYVVRHVGAAQGKDLGDAKAIDEAIGALRQALRDPQRSDARELARVVDESVMRPIREWLGDATQLLVSPDGELNLIPFAALVDEQGRFLIQRYSLSYLTSGRDLLRMKIARESKSGPIVLANPSFGETNELPAKANSATSPSKSKTERPSVTTGQDLSQVYFAPLGGTAQEARSIQSLFPDASLLIGPQATKAALEQTVAPRVLHIATHGFFLGEPATVNNLTRSINATPNVTNPLLRSGLALAGANRHNVGGDDDGILTALEASNLNLWGTKLVVLSACDTGVGEVRNGEGVYGLRRAFVIAGAESLVMSLWPISDYSTRVLMTNYYKNLKQDMGRGEALRRVQLDMLKRNPSLHPFYWANFIQSGDWTKLDGRH
ncbi:MAG: tetratricopeptide repeat protein [Acidobacteria bacterium]|nr:tetratricopeptide repeat protein [Acidobacteriota bacterium]